MKLRTNTKAGIFANQNETSSRGNRGTRCLTLALALALGNSASAQSLLKNEAGGARQALRDLPGARVTAAQRQALAAYGAEVTVSFGDEEVPTLLMGQLSARVRPDDAVAESQAALKRHGAAFRVGTDDGFTFSAFEPDRSGVPSVRMAQTYKGLPVIGGELVVHLSQEQVTGIRGHFVPDLNARTEPSISAGEAVASAFSYASEAGYRNPQIGETGTPAIYVDHAGAGRLVLPVRITRDSAEGSVREDVFVDASAGGVVGTTMIAAAAVPGGSPNMIVNPGFESGPSAWTLSDPAFWGNGDGRASLSQLILCSALAPVGHGGSCWTVLGSWTTFPVIVGSCKNACPNTLVDMVGQTVTVPSNAGSATLKFFLRIDADQRSRPVNYLYVTITTPDGSSVHQTYSNVDASSPAKYVAAPALTMDVSRFRGQKIRVAFTGAQTFKTYAGFWIDDVSLTFSSVGPVF